MTMTKRTIAATVAAAGLVLFAGSAQALSSVEMIWRNNGSATIGTPSINGSSTITADIVITSDTVGVIGVFVSFVYDASELTFLTGGENASVKISMGNSFTPLAAGVFENTAGFITNFDQATLSTGMVGGEGARTLGSLIFHVSNPTGDNSDIDIIAGILNPGIDSIETTSGSSTANFFGASVTGPPPVPEPTTALLLIAGLAGLGYAGRRSLR